MSETTPHPVTLEYYRATAARPRLRTTESLRPRRAHITVGLGLGLAAYLLVDGRPLGLGFSLVMVSLLVAAAAAGGREAWQSAKEHRILWGAAALLFSCAALQSAAWLTALETAAGFILATLALHGWPGGTSVAALSPGALLLRPPVTVATAAALGVSAQFREARTSLADTEVRPALVSTLRLLAIVTPPVALVTLLLASGDAAFESLVTRALESLGEMPFASAIRGVVVTVLSGAVATGTLLLASRRSSGEASASGPTRRLSTTEANALLAVLTAVLLLFGATSWNCALSHDACALPPGVTWAEAARRGFFQLLTAAVVILSLLMALPARTAFNGARDERGFRLLATALMLSTLPMLLSGIGRLALYEEMYGLTRLRVMARAGYALVAAVLCWRALTLWVARRHFVTGALVLCTASLLTLTALRPDAMIARQQLTRSTPDAWYVMELSRDAASAVASGMEHLPGDERRQLRAWLEEDAPRRAALGLGGWNLGAWLAGGVTLPPVDDARGQCADE